MTTNGAAKNAQAIPLFSEISLFDVARTSSGGGYSLFFPEFHSIDYVVETGFLLKPVAPTFESYAPKLH
jgi:hypothetical protein